MKNAPAPQVLARSVIRRRYPRASEETEDDPVASSLEAITFYCNDERMPLPDPSISEANEVDSDPMMDVVADNPVELRNLLTLRSDPSESQPTDEFKNGIIEVFGPASKGPRISRLDSEGVSFGEQPGFVPKSPVHIPEESSESTEITNPGLNPMITQYPTTIPC